MMRINILWEKYNRIITTFSIVMMVFLCTYSMGVLYTNMPKFIINIGIIFCVLVQCFYFQKISIEINRVIKTIIIAGTLCGFIILDSYLVKSTCILILVYLCLGNKIKEIEKVAVPANILLVAIVGLQVSKAFSIRYKSALVLQFMIKWVLNAVGVNAELTDGFLLVNLSGKIIKYAVTSDALMLYTFCVVCIILWGFLLKRSLKNFIKMFIGFLLIVIMRFVTLIVIYNYTERLNVLWGIEYNLFLCLCMTIFVTLGLDFRQKSKVCNVNISYGTWAFYIASILGIFMLILGHEYGSVGKEKQGRILIDEWHSQGWESLEEPLNTTQYLGQKSVYTYTSMVNFLKELYSVTIGNDEELLVSLDNYDILIIKTPTKSFKEEEIQRIKKFMKNGGGVFLVGDHTNLFNMDKYLNDISKEYGIELNYDAVYDITDGNFVNAYNNKFVQNQSIAAVDKYKFATSCSIKTDFLARIEMSLENGCAEYMDLSQINFFGNMIPEPSEKWGEICVAASREVGKGRLFVFSDSTTFSSFSIFMHDNPEFLIGILEYLNYENVINVYYIISAIMILAAIVIYMRQKKQIIHDIIIANIIGICVFGYISSYTTLTNMKNANNVNSRLDSINTIYFLDDNKLSHFIGYNLLQENYQNVFLDIQRHGKILREKDKIDDCVKTNSEALFITNNDRELSNGEKDKLEKYVSKGGKLVLLDSHLNNKDSMNQILHIFGISPINQPMFSNVITEENESIKLQTMYTNYYSKQSSTFKETIVSEYPSNFNMNIFGYKKGTIYIINDAYYLTNDFMGDPGTSASNQQYELHQAFHSLIEKIL